MFKQVQNDARVRVVEVVAVKVPEKQLNYQGRAPFLRMDFRHTEKIAQT